MSLDEFKQVAPLLTEAEARRRAQQLILGVAMLGDRERARERFNSRGLWAQGSELLYRDRDRGGELTVLGKRVG